MSTGTAFRPLLNCSRCRRLVWSLSVWTIQNIRENQDSFGSATLQTGEASMTDGSQVKVYDVWLAPVQVSGTKKFY